MSGFEYVFIYNIVLSSNMSAELLHSVQQMLSQFTLELRLLVSGVFARSFLSGFLFLTLKVSVVLDMIITFHRYLWYLCSSL